MKSMKYSEFIILFFNVKLVTKKRIHATAMYPISGTDNFIHDEMKDTIYVL